MTTRAVLRNDLLGDSQAMSFRSVVIMTCSADRTDPIVSSVINCIRSLACNEIDGHQILVHVCDVDKTAFSDPALFARGHAFVVIPVMTPNFLLGLQFKDGEEWDPEKHSEWDHPLHRKRALARLEGGASINRYGLEVVYAHSIPFPNVPAFKEFTWYHVRGGSALGSLPASELDANVVDITQRIAKSAINKGA
jgi:hypothetical protein